MIIIIRSGSFILIVVSSGDLPFPCILIDTLSGGLCSIVPRENMCSLDQSYSGLGSNMIIWSTQPNPTQPYPFFKFEILGLIQASNIGPFCIWCGFWSVYLIVLGLHRSWPSMASHTKLYIACWWSSIYMHLVLAEIFNVYISFFNFNMLHFYKNIETCDFVKDNQYFLET